MNKDLLESALTAIQAYYDRLKDTATPTVMMESDFRKYVSEKEDFYHDGEEDMRSFYFYHELYRPLLEILAVMKGNVDLEIDPSTLPSDFRISTSEAVEVLTSTFPIKRELILASISCPLSDFNHLKPGILEANESELSQVKADLSDHFKRLKLAAIICGEVHGHTNDDVLTALYRGKIRRSIPNTAEASFEEMRNTAKGIVVDFWREKAVYSTSEIEIIEGIIKSDIFRGFREDCAVEYKRKYGQRPERRPTVVVKENTKVVGDTIIGVRGLATYLRCGGDKAQNIVSCGVLQKAGVSFKVGRTNQFDKKKLDAFLSAHPQALAKITKKNK